MIAIANCAQYDDVSLNEDERDAVVAADASCSDHQRATPHNLKSPMSPLHHEEPLLNRRSFDLDITAGAMPQEVDRNSQSSGKSALRMLQMFKWKPLLIMVATLLLGIGLAAGYHIYYSWLGGQDSAPARANGLCDT
ncbi:hypothetical protein K458DRAFT_408196 [Lentithecium fluviatile CBS 122367]|uniref:Uncharacterized protein n=1 Tax=Lentithecium fluviatile CBS 122367 TaxID=1168545 RepID=A0A6G1IN90_9PLEO|nr:hypothetical protein K458DRAFT_408196 [Lentithecium fluviatile CBS 122367]